MCVYVCVPNINQIKNLNFRSPRSHLVPLSLYTHRAYLFHSPLALLE